MNRSKTKWPIIAGLVILLLIVIRFAVLPPVALAVINKQINSQPGVRGEVHQVGFRLVRGIATLKGIRLEMHEPGSLTRIEAREAESRIHWGQLFHGGTVADVDVIRPTIEYVSQAPAQKASPEQLQSKLSHELKKQPKFRINTLQIREGTLHFKDETKSPTYVLTADHINANVTNISNSRKLTDTLFANFDVTAVVMNSGKAHMFGKFNPVHRPAEFKLNLALDGLDLPKLNPALTAAKDIQIKQGTLSLASEVATKNGEVDGYVKPVLKDLQVSDVRKDLKKGVGHAIKEQALDVAGKVAENPSKNEAATRIPFHGKLDDPKAGVRAAIGATLRNMFVQAITPNIEHSVSMAKTG